MFTTIGRGKQPAAIDDKINLKLLLFYRRTAFGLQDARALLLPFLTAHPEGLIILHQIGQNGAPQKDHVLAFGGIFNANLYLLHPCMNQ